MPLLSLLRIENRGKAAFSQQDWEDVLASGLAVGKWLAKVMEPAEHAVDLGDVVAAVFKDRDSYDQAVKLAEDTGTLPKGLGLAWTEFEIDSEPEWGFVQKALKMVPF